jgi:hypothetical protein
MDDFAADFIAGLTNQSDGLGKEEAFIRRLFSFYKMVPFYQEFKDRATEDGIRHLNFDYFSERFPSFPVYLIYGKVAYAHQEILLQNLLRGKFLKSKIFKKYEEVTADSPGNLTALVFQVANIGTFVLHNLVGDGDENGTSLIIRSKASDTYILEQDEAFYVRVGNEWTG